MPGADRARAPNQLEAHEGMSGLEEVPRMNVSHRFIQNREQKSEQADEEDF